MVAKAGGGKGGLVQREVGDLVKVGVGGVMRSWWGRGGGSRKISVPCRVIGADDETPTFFRNVLQLWRSRRAGHRRLGRCRF